MAKINWIGEQQAEELLGLKAATIKIYIAAGKLKIRRSKASYKSKSSFHIGDIEAHLNNRQIA